MLDFILGFLFGRYSNLSEEFKESEKFNSDYIPKFTARLNEAWTGLIEPDYDPLYVQLVDRKSVV